MALENRISEIGGVSYKIYILPGLLMMNVITNAVANSASSMLQMKLLQTLPELLITPLSSLELSLSFIIGGTVRCFFIGILILFMKNKKVLLRHFGGLESLRKASIDQIKSIDGIGSIRAKLIYEYLNEK